MSAELDHLEVYEAKDGWRWRRRAINGRIVAESGEGYEDEDHARSMAESRNPGITIMADVVAEEPGD